MKKKQDFIYAVYRGDTFIDVGTLDEICFRMKWTKETLKFYCSASYHRRIAAKYGVKIAAYRYEDTTNAEDEIREDPNIR